MAINCGCELYVKGEIDLFNFTGGWSNHKFSNVENRNFYSLAELKKLYKFSDIE